MSSLPDFSTMTLEEIEAYITKQKAEVTLLHTLRDPRKRSPRVQQKDPEEQAKHALRILAKVAGRSNRQAEQAIQRRTESADAYQTGVIGYLADRGLTELPEEFYRELGDIWTYHNTPQKDRPE